MTGLWLRRRLRACRGDEGMGLVFVMLIGTAIMILLGTAGATLINQIGPARDTTDNGAAMAAAEAGVEDFVATVNANCPPVDGSFYCTWLTTGRVSSSISDPTSQAGTTIPGADNTGTRGAFYWKVTLGISGFARVTSVGQVVSPSGAVTKTRTLVADVNATPSFNNFEYFTKYETFPADFVDGFYTARNIQVTDATGSSLGGAGALHWQGTCTSDDPNDLSHCTPPGGTQQTSSTNICNDLYYPSSYGPGRGTDAAWDNAARRPTAAMTAMFGGETPTDYPEERRFAYYSEQGTFAPSSGSSVAETHNDVCDSSFEPNMIMNGPIYSQDAYLIDQGKTTGNSCNSMPNFGDYAYTMWDGAINGTQQPTGSNGGYNRSYPNTDGKICTSKSPQPVYTTQELTLPPNADSSQGLATCTYTGPTRILLVQGITHITSPGTPTAPAPPGPSYCYASNGNFGNAADSDPAAGGGVVDAQVPVGSALIYVGKPTTGSPGTANRTSPVFDLTTNLTVPPSTSGDTLQGAWTDNATYSASDPCPAAGTTSARRNFDCETSAANPPADVFKAIKNAVDGVVGGSDADTAVQGDLQTAISSKIDKQVVVNQQTGAKQNVLVAAPPSTLNNGDVRYLVTVGALNAGTSTSTTPASQSDAFFQSTQGQGYTTTPKSWSITITRYACTVTGGCTSSSQMNKLPLVTGNATRTTNAANSPVNSTSRFPWFGKKLGDTGYDAAKTYTDMDNDVTRYDTGYGDAYVQGTLHGQLTIVAEHDIVATNDITYANTNLNTTTDGLALVADNDVRVYRPLTCTDDGAVGSTSPGYCPNDLTGVYTAPLSWPMPSSYPAMKYKPDNAPSMTGTATGSGNGLLYATIFTLQGCFMSDNFYQGNQLGLRVTIYGGLYQNHRGPTSLPFQGRPFQGSLTKMPGVLLTYNFDNMRAGQTANGGLRVPWIPSPQDRPSGSTRTWNVVSISTGT